MEQKPAPSALPVVIVLAGNRLPVPAFMQDTHAPDRYDLGWRSWALAEAGDAKENAV